jgi:hypothetical protein
VKKQGGLFRGPRHADCLRIITRAEMRMADELDKNPPKEGRPPKTVRALDSLNFDDLGLDRRRVSEWRETRDAGEEAVEEAIQGALSEGRAAAAVDSPRRQRRSAGT